MDIFEKCYQRYIQDEVREQGVYPYFHALESRQDTEVIMEGKRRIMLGSNNYLGLTTNSSVIEAGVQAYRTLGSGCSGSRFLNGTLKLHLELEDELAKFLRKDAVVTFSTGFQSNLGIISSIVGLHDYVIMDRENHASLYDGCKLSYGKMLRYQHNDMADLEKKLQKVPDTAGCLIVTDGVFSMGGDIANLPEICALAQKYGARVMVDDAHGLGVIGEGVRVKYEEILTPNDMGDVAIFTELGRFMLAPYGHLISHIAVINSASRRCAQALNVRLKPDGTLVVFGKFCPKLLIAER